ncbi:hypothetical protein [uncultured Methylobacterium sp.]|jgi:hypothetical protein|uniref:hypothetical protein n=1 Tax=uncultured Methylobacterium sp. TaxID=157278 RepID=UPI002632644A|nr:hypothetical protein [uncultured Methylobacterium sp.]
MAAGATLVRYDTRRDRHGWTVYDLRSGETAILDDVLQIGLDRDAADRLADALSAAGAGEDGPKASVPRDA